VEKIMLTLDYNHIYRYNDVIVPGVSEILEAGGFTDFSHVNDKILEDAQHFGTAAHAVCELDDLEEFDEKGFFSNKENTPLIPYLESWRKFKKDFFVDIAYIEYKVYSKKWGFAGMLDRVIHPGEVKTLILVDLKSSTTILPATELQTAAYKMAFEEQTGLKISQRWNVQLCPDGNYKIHKYKNRTDERVFLGAVMGYHFKKENNLL
jgi:hypothetical protein